MSDPPYQAAACYRHPDRETLIACQRCRRPICPECMIAAAVGFQCPQCVADGARSTRADAAPFGGLRSASPAQTTVVLIALNVVVWLALLLSGGAESPWYSVVALLPDGDCAPAGRPGYLYPGVGEEVCRTLGDTAVWHPGVAEGAYWQLLTSAFAHVDVLHIGFNMVALWFLGPQLEVILGRARFLALYLVSALGGSALVCWLSSPDSTSLGASGALFGLMGALLVIAVKARGNVTPILLWLGFNVAYTVFGRGSISWQGHLGGLLTGTLIAAILAYAPRRNRAAWQWGALALLTFLLVAAVVVRSAELA